MQDEPTTRLRLQLHGHVQGVGFRPFVHRLATELNLTGWVNNSPRGVVIEAEGLHGAVRQFLLRLEPEQPPPASIQGVEPVWLEVAGYSEFEIVESDSAGTAGLWVVPDIATCGACLKELFDPGDRRYRYPFLNCSHCGPRYSILHALPYDRGNTSMKNFKMCEACESEYRDPANRRHHAQPNACPQCGPHLEYWGAQGARQASHAEALDLAVTALREGKIVAVKGVGGFHLVTDARNASTIQSLRDRKHRKAKPLALLFPDLRAVRRACDVSELEARALSSPEAPIVLLPKRGNDLPENIAPDNPHLGILLPSNPLHHLIMKECDFPVVATSGNLSEETLCTDNDEAIERLGGIADAFLVHNRDIVNHVDDSIVRVVLEREMVLRRGRGLAPSTFSVPPRGNPAPHLLAVGPHLKNTVALYKENEIVLSQHIGDLDTVQSVDTFKQTIDRLCGLFDIDPRAVAHDRHPDYASSQHARTCGQKTIPIQHHYAHVLACMLDNALEPPVLGVSWDGTGLGTDNTIWGGEFLQIHNKGFTREGHFRTFPLIGGDRGIRDPRRAAVGLLYEMYGKQIFDKKEWIDRLKLSAEESRVFAGMLDQGLNVHRTSSAGRLFDAVSALTGLCRHNRYEGEAAMRLENSAGLLPFPQHGPAGETPASDDNWVGEDEILGSRREPHAASKQSWTPNRYTFKITESRNPETGAKSGSPYVYMIDWQPMIEELLDDLRRGADIRTVSQTFHNTLAEMVVEMAKAVGVLQVVLTGGCFQNRVLTERTVAQLRQAGFDPHWHQRIPPNDGGIAVGQILAALRSPQTFNAGA